MARTHHYRRRPRDAEVDLDMTTFLNLMVALVPFLLVTAVFSTVSVVELDLPSSSGGVASEVPAKRVEVIVREAGLEISDGKDVIAAIPKVAGEYDLVKLSEYLLELKRQYPQKDDASVLLEPKIKYDHLINVMDVVKSAEVDQASGLARVALFPAVSIGEAP
jgi:biopolymer transport protein ExbD